MIQFEEMKTRNEIRFWTSITMEQNASELNLMKLIMTAIRNNDN